MRLCNKGFKRCGTAYQVISTLIILMVMCLFVKVFDILGGRSIVPGDIKLVTRIQTIQEIPPLRDERCVNLSTGIPEIRPSYLPHLANPCWYAEGGDLRCLPYFYLAGLPKCGTTDLYKQISRHPDIIMPDGKEPHWMSKARFGVRNRSLVAKDIMQYSQFFEGLTAAVLSRNISAYKSITGDASTSTLWYNKHWNRLRENCGLKEPEYITAHYIKYLLPRVKIMAMMRNPTERLFSGYLYFGGGEKSIEDFHKEVVNAINIFNSCLSTFSMRACTYNETIGKMSKVRLHIGLYDVLVQDWMKVFPEEQLHFIRFEDYIKDRLTTVKKIYRFLEIRPLTLDEEFVVWKDPFVTNANNRKKNALGPMRPDTRRLLDDFYRPHNEQLAKLLGDEGYLWQ